MRPTSGRRGAHGRVADQDRVLLCTHGGGYVTASMYTHRKVYGHLAKAIGCRALILNYRRAPEHVHPAPVDDAVTAYRWLHMASAVPPPDTKRWVARCNAVIVNAVRSGAISPDQARHRTTGRISVPA